MLEPLQERNRSGGCSTLTKYRLALSVLLLLAIVGCKQAPIGNFHIITLNTVTEYHPESCAGGLEVQARLASVEIYNKVVAAGEVDETGTGTAQIPNGYELVYQGAPVVVEAWCLGEGGTEVGYAKKQGSLNVYEPEASVFVTPDIPGRAECLSDAERGNPPCIESGIIE